MMNETQKRRQNNICVSHFVFAWARDQNSCYYNEQAWVSGVDPFADSFFISSYCSHVDRDEFNTENVILKD